MVLVTQRLTPLQVKVLVLLSGGDAYKTIGGKLNMSTHNVAYHVGRMQGMLGARNLPALIAMSVAARILTSDSFPLGICQGE
jgi:DNA-binding CsgD family transcriptional regulator